MAVKICIIGAAGRMGKNIAEAVYNNENAIENFSADFLYNTTLNLQKLKDPLRNYYVSIQISKQMSKFF